MEEMSPTIPRPEDRLQMLERPHPEIAAQRLPGHEPTALPRLTEDHTVQDEPMDLKTPQVSVIEPGPPEVTTSTCLVPPQDRTPPHISTVIPSSPPAPPTSSPTFLQPTSPRPVTNEASPPRMMAESPKMPSEHVDSDRESVSEGSALDTPITGFSSQPPVKSEMIEDEPMPANEALPEELEPVIQEDIIPVPPPASRRTASVAIVEVPAAMCRSEVTLRKQPTIPASRPKRMYNFNGVFARSQFLPWPFHVLNEDDNKSAVLLIEVCTMGYGQIHALIDSTLGDVSPHSIELSL
jgi:hypothetical protein